MKFQNLSQAQKAAILIRFLGEETAAELFKQMSRDEVKRMSAAVSSLGRVDESLVQEVLAEFLGQLRHKKLALFGGPEQTARILRKAVPDLGEGFAKDIHMGSEKLVELLAQFDHRYLVAYLVKEHPQTGAVILAHLEPARCAAVLKDMPEGMQGELMIRVARLDGVSPLALEQLIEALEEELRKYSGGSSRQIGGVDTIVKMLAQMDEESEEKFLERLEQRDPTLATEVKSRLFTFSDLVKLDDRAIQLVLKDVDEKTLVVALRGAEEPVMEKFLRNLSSRRSQQLRDDLDHMAPIPKRDIAAARSKIMAVVQALKQAGSIHIERLAS